MSRSVFTVMIVVKESPIQSINNTTSIMNVNEQRIAAIIGQQLLNELYGLAYETAGRNFRNGYNQHYVPTSHDSNSDNRPNNRMDEDGDNVELLTMKGDETIDWMAMTIEEINGALNHNQETLPPAPNTHQMSSGENSIRPSNQTMRVAQATSEIPDSH
ncbi:8284_t:CDS:1, partial [Paraglomus occultum]